MKAQSDGSSHVVPGEYAVIFSVPRHRHPNSWYPQALPAVFNNPLRPLYQVRVGKYGARRVDFNLTSHASK